MGDIDSKLEKPTKTKAPRKTTKEKKPPTPKRDNFSLDTTRRLRDMAGNVCSFPECSRITHGSKAERTGPFSIGVACHIKAAAPGGPRYDAAQTKEERKHLSNGIWMCRTHSVLIDADDSPYPVETLLEWKKTAELRSNQMVNQQTFSMAEVKEKARTESMDSLYSYINRGDNPLRTPLSDIIGGYSNALSKLDPRFKVDVNTEGGIAHHTIKAVTPDAKFTVNIGNISEIDGFLDNEKALFEEGRPLTIHSPHFKFSDSKLFESIQEHAPFSSITIQGVSKPAKTNLYAIDGDHEHFISDYTSHSTLGTKRLIIEGSCLGGFFKTKYQHDIEKNQSKFDLTYNIDAWKGKNIAKLPYFPRLAKALPPLEKGRFVVEFELGDELVRLDSNSGDSLDEFTGTFIWLISTIQSARTIAELCDKPIILNETEIDEKTQALLNKYSRLIKGQIESTRPPSLLCDGIIELHEDVSLEKLSDEGKLNEIILSHNTPERLNLFGQVIQAPRVRINYSNTESFLYCPIDNPKAISIQVFTTDKTTIKSSLVTEDHWQIIDQNY